MEEKFEIYYNRYRERYFKMLKRNMLNGAPSNDWHTIGHPKKTIEYAKSTHMTTTITDKELKNSCKLIE